LAKDDGVFELDDGPALGLGPNVHPGLFSALEEMAKVLEMTVHTDPHPRYSGTDAFGLQIARAGIPTGLVSIPLRYMHTMVETATTADVERAGRLLGEFVARLDASFLDEISTAMMEKE
jgi:endoglucanase